MNAAELRVSLSCLNVNSIQSIAVFALDITACKTDKYLPLTYPGSFSLNRTEYLMKLGMFHAYYSTEQRLKLQGQHPIIRVGNFVFYPEDTKNISQVIVVYTSNFIFFLDKKTQIM